jgi:arylsulfatase
MGKDQGERDFLYREFLGYGGQQSVWMGNRWKGIRTNLLKKDNPDPLAIELFDLDADPSESTNVAEKHPEVLQKIEGLMKSERTISESFPFPPLDALVRQ